MKGIFRQIFSGDELLVHIILPAGVTGIGQGAFAYCASLTSITIPNSVTSIDTRAFQDCPSLTRVTFQGTIPSNGFNEWAFDGDLRAKYLAGGKGTYTTTAPVGENSTWNKGGKAESSAKDNSKSGGKASALVGRWVHESGVTRGKPENIQLLKDGTGICDDVSITWKVEGNRLIIQSSFFGLACDYNKSGSKLTLTYDDGGSAIFAKK